MSKIAFAAASLALAAALASGCGPDKRTDAQKAEDKRILDETEKAKDFHDAAEWWQQQGKLGKR